MPVETTIVLGRFRYLRPPIGQRVSPYIWPFLASIASKPYFDYRTQTFGDARVVIMNNMGPAHTPNIPASQATLPTTFQEDQTDPAVLIVVALWEKRDTPDKCVKAAFEAFSSELRLRLGHRITALKEAFDADDQNEINVQTQAIINDVRKAIESAIESNLDLIDKAKLFAGLMDLDQFVGASFRLFSNPLSATSFTLAFQGTAFERREYEIQGNLHVGQVTSPVNPGQLLSYGDAGTPGNVSSPVVVGFGGWQDFKFLFSGENVAGENRIYAVNQNGQLLSYGDAGTPGNVSSPVVVGFGGWQVFKFLFSGRNLAR